MRKRGGLSCDYELAALPRIVRQARQPRKLLAELTPPYDSYGRFSVKSFNFALILA